MVARGTRDGAVTEPAPLQVVPSGGLRDMECSCVEDGLECREINEGTADKLPLGASLRRSSVRVVMPYAVVLVTVGSRPKRVESSGQLAEHCTTTLRDDEDAVMPYVCTARCQLRNGTRKAICNDHSSNSRLNRRPLQLETSELQHRWYRGVLWAQGSCRN
jgi:hypothetical protein